MSVILTRSAGGGGQSSSGGNLVLVAEYAVTPALPSALGTNSIVLGESAQTSTTAPNSLAIGEQSLTRHPGAMVLASGRFQSSGDAQTGKYLLRAHTISNAATELFIDGTNGSQRLVMPDDSTWTFKITITAHRTDDSDGHAGYTVAGVVYKVAGNASITFQGYPIKNILAESNPGWGINIIADTTYGALVIKATGEAGKTIRWLALVETVEITN